MYGLIKRLKENDVEFYMTPVNELGVKHMMIRLEKDDYHMYEIVDIDLIEMNKVVTIEQFLINMVERFVKEAENNG